MLPPIPLARYATVPGGQMLHIRPPTRYASLPPALTGFRPTDAARASEMLRLFARPHVDCPAEAVMLYRNALVLDGKQVLGADGTGVAESFPLLLQPHHAGWQQTHLDRVARGDLAHVDPAGPPVVAIFGECAFNYGHMLVEMLPRLVLLAEMGLRELRLLFPAEAEPLRAMVSFALHAMGLTGTLLPCPAGTALRVAALHWVSPVALHEHRKSPTLLRLMEHLRAAAPPPDGPARLYIARPAAARRKVVNAAAVEQAAVAAGYAVVEPSRLDFPTQLALFAGARQILGPMGAALTSLAAMAPGGTVAMLDDGACDPFFWDLACLCEQRFRCGFTGDVAAYDMAMLDRPMTVPPALLAELLA